MDTIHARARKQQRAIPPLIDQWLDEFGAEAYDERHGICRYFDHVSVRRMERQLGHRPVQLMARFLNVYKIVSSTDGATITTGWRTKRIRRK
jgi:hypothetical protein